MWREKAIEALMLKNLKLTPQRLKLIDIIEEIGKKHPTFGEILEKIRKDFPTTSFSTLYTNILIFKELGLIEVFTVGNETRIETNLTPHMNVYDDEIRDCQDDEILRKIEERIGKKIKLVIVIPDQR
ncbi:MAG: transcriptional repressor [Archaeoglobaceae archaeon]|nr:transcriptional repressor [Archaeoglobaceae archaeon]MDW8014267.1 transcriptional repressor [Archaeoglobaceae archaeon]